MKTVTSASHPDRFHGFKGRFGGAAARAARLVVGLLLFVSAGCGASDDSKSPGGIDESAAETAPRNIILITMDTTRADALGVYGQVLPATPRIDRMASEGLRFAQVTTSSPSTFPSHSTILTGKHPYAHGVRSNAGYVLAESNVTLAEALHTQGYRTAAEIAAPVIDRDTLLNQGFESYRDTKSPDVKGKDIQLITAKGEKWIHLEERMAAEITSRGIQFLRIHRNENFFLWLHYFDPHQSLAPPAEFRARLPENLYHAEILYVDDEIGRLLDAVRGLGLKQSTLVVLTADHGESLKEHSEPNHSFFVYDSTMRVPLILWGPAFLGRGSVVESLVRTVDIAPTILDLLKLPPLVDIQGVSFARLITGESSDLHLTGYGESIELMLVGASPIRFVREGDWKYLHKINPELYNVSRDPRELDNVVAQNPQIVERLRSKLEALITEAPSKLNGGEIPIDAATRNQLEALGYLAVAPPVNTEDIMASLELVGVDPADVLDDVERVSRATGAFKNQRYEDAAQRFAFLWEKYHQAQFGLRLTKALIEIRRFQDLSDLVEEILVFMSDDHEHLARLGDYVLKAGRFDDADKLLQASLAVNRCFSNTRISAALLAFARERYEEQIEILRVGAEECVGSSELLNNFAYALATSPLDDQRDGERAVKFALEVIEGDASPNAGHLDTLAAAYAELGDFERALVHSRRSIELERELGRPGEVAQLQRNLARFEMGQPLRDP